MFYNTNVLHFTMLGHYFVKDDPNMCVSVSNIVFDNTNVVHHITTLGSFLIDVPIFMLVFPTLCSTIPMFYTTSQCWDTTLLKTIPTCVFLFPILYLTIPMSYTTLQPWDSSCIAIPTSIQLFPMLCSRHPVIGIGFTDIVLLFHDIAFHFTT